MQLDTEELETEEVPEYPTAHDLPNPEHHRGPVGMPQPAYDADMLNFLQHTVADSYYPNLIRDIRRAAITIVRTDQLGGRYPAITQRAAEELVALADEYIFPFEYVVTNIKDSSQFRSVANDYRMAAANTKEGTRAIDYNNTFISFIGRMESHLTGAKLTRSFGGFERVAQQTQRAELTSTYEHKKPVAPSSGLSRLLGRG